MYHALDNLRLLAIVLCLPFALGCGSEYLEDHGPENRRSKQGDVHCYSSFGKLKRAMHKRGTPKKTNWAWHHIVGQNKINVGTFGARDLHCTDNIVYIDRPTHIKITTFYNRGHQWTGGRPLYEWLAAQSFDEQYEYGLKVLKDHGIQL